MKNILPFIPIYLLIAIMGIFLFLYLPHRGSQLSAEDVMKQLNQRDSIIQQKIDDQGRLVTTHTNRQYDPYIIVNSNSSEMVELRKELKDLGISIKDLKSSITINSEATGGGDVQLVQLQDTLDTYEFQDSSEHLEIKGRVDVANKMMDYEYKYKSKYSVYSYEYKAGFFKKPELRLKIVSDDPSNNIKLQTFTIKPPREIVSLGGGVGMSAIYDQGQIKFRPSIHIGIYKPIYTFRSKK